MKDTDEGALDGALRRALTARFARQRVVLWQDDNAQFAAQFEALQLPDVPGGAQMEEVKNNEFGLKIRVLQEQAEQKFLLYVPHAAPPPEKDFLLDVRARFGVFYANQEGLLLEELGLTSGECADVARAHAAFFRSRERVQKLKAQLAASDGASAMRLKMLAVCAGCDARLHDALMQLLQETAEDGDKKSALIKHCGLDDFLWQQAERTLGYASDKPGAKDFALWLFVQCFAAGADDAPLAGASAAQMFMKRWKDSRAGAAAFEKLSGECAAALGIEDKLQDMRTDALLRMDYFLAIDQKIIHDALAAVAAGTAGEREARQWLQARRRSFWFEAAGLEPGYAAAAAAAGLFAAIDAADFGQLPDQTMADALRQYCKADGGWFMADQLYRKFVFFAGAARQTPALAGQERALQQLQEKVENRYVNDFLLKLGDASAAAVENTLASGKWSAGGADAAAPRQDAFFARFARPFLRHEGKVCVVISDALRFEAGEELLRRIQQEDRYTGEIAPMLALLPSFTQLGMAALLPHARLSFAAGGDAVLADGQSTRGTEARDAVLRKWPDGRGRAIKFDAFDALPLDERREMIKGVDALYVYHDRIDRIADKAQGEGEAAAAVEDALDELLRLVKKLTAANVNNMLITADHGFIFQNRPIEESDFSSAEARGDEVWEKSRRYVLGAGLQKARGLHWLSAEAMGLEGAAEALIPKSINRLRLQGSGSRFVHGGAALQETALPVLHVKKKRKSDVAPVEVEIYPPKGAVTTGLVVARAYQMAPVSEKSPPRELFAGVYDGDDLISDEMRLRFDSASEQPNEREMTVKLTLGAAAERSEGKMVELRFLQMYGDTARKTVYAKFAVQLRRAFGGDFLD